MIKHIAKGYRILSDRLRKHGLRTTLVWAFGRGVPRITGAPLLRYSRVTPNIYVGPQFFDRGKKLLEREGIRYDVNLRIEFDDAAHGLALENYCYLPTIDDTPPTIEHLDEGVAFIREAVANGEKVYIHCAGGIGRAPTMAAAYFIAEEGLTTDEAVAKIQAVRPFINMVPGQFDVLRAYESHLRDRAVADA